MNNHEKKKALLSLANRVKDLRKVKGVNQQEAYEDTKIHFGRIEQGKTDVGYTTLIRIALYFGIRIDELFDIKI